MDVMQTGIPHTINSVHEASLILFCYRKKIDYNYNYNRKRSLDALHRQHLQDLGPARSKLDE